MINSKFKSANAIFCIILTLCLLVTPFTLAVSANVEDGVVTDGKGRHGDARDGLVSDDGSDKNALESTFDSALEGVSDGAQDMIDGAQDKVNGSQDMGGGSQGMTDGSQGTTGGTQDMSESEAGSTVAIVICLIIIAAAIVLIIILVPKKRR